MSWLFKLLGNSNSTAEVDATPLALRNIIYDSAGNVLSKTKGSTNMSTHSGTPSMGVNDGVYRFIRVGRNGGQAQERFLPFTNFNLYTAALPPSWLNNTTTMTTSYATTSGALLNASAIVTASTNNVLVSQQVIPKFQKSPIWSRTRARLVKGGANAIAEFGFFGTQTPGSTIMPNGFVFLFAADGTLKPTYYLNSTIVAQGIDFASSIDPTRYYTYDIVVDDDNVSFYCQDPTTGIMISEQTINILQGDPRIGLQPYFFIGTRCYQTGTAGTGAATQIYIADQTGLMLDTDAYKPWSHTQSCNGFGLIVNPTVALTQLENYINSAAPASATLSNTSAGYTTLGGQFQFVAPAGAETDYALFAFTVPTGVKMFITGIHIETFNMGAASATTPSLLQWFAGENGLAVTLASNNYRKSLGVQSIPIGSAIGYAANPIDLVFETPLCTHTGRIFHIGLKIPVGTATVSQIIRGQVQLRGYFE
jgi:hypothetical protein